MMPKGDSTMKKTLILIAAVAFATWLPFAAQAADSQPHMSDMQHHKTMGAAHHPQDAQKPDCDKNKQLHEESKKVGKHAYHERTDNPED